MDSAIGIFKFISSKGNPLRKRRPNAVADGQLANCDFYMHTELSPELTVLIGGMRVLNTNYDQSQKGVFTNRPEALTNDFFVNLLDLGTKWSPTSDAKDIFEGRDRSTNALKWTATRADLIFGSSSELRAIAEVYGVDDSQDKFVRDFISAWTKVMNLGRYD